MRINYLILALFFGLQLAPAYAVRETAAPRAALAVKSETLLGKVDKRVEILPVEESKMNVKSYAIKIQSELEAIRVKCPYAVRGLPNPCVGTRGLLLSNTNVLTIYNANDASIYSTTVPLARLGGDGNQVVEVLRMVLGIPITYTAGCRGSCTTEPPAPPQPPAVDPRLKAASDDAALLHNQMLAGCNSGKRLSVNQISALVLPNATVQYECGDGVYNVLSVPKHTADIAVDEDFLKNLLVTALTKLGVPTHYSAGVRPPVKGGGDDSFF